jgi:hypothetical protein
MDVSAGSVVALQIWKYLTSKDALHDIAPTFCEVLAIDWGKQNKISNR